MPVNFQATMNELLKSSLCKFAAVFYDDILVYNRTFAEHLLHLSQVFTTLLQGKFFLKSS